MGLHHKKPYHSRAVGLGKDVVFPGEDLLRQQVISRGFCHFLPIEGQHIGMHPVPDRALAVAGFGLGDLTFMVGEFKIHPAAVDIKAFAKVFGTHYSTFQVPSRESLSPW